MFLTILAICLLDFARHGQVLEPPAQRWSSAVLDPWTKQQTLEKTGELVYVCII